MSDIRKECKIFCTAHDNKEFTCDDSICLKRRAFLLGKAEAFEEVYNRIDEGVCEMCEHDSPTCHEKCWCENWNLETLFKWLDKKRKEHSNE